MIVCNGVIVDGRNRVVIKDGEEIPFHKKMNGYSVVQTNDQLTIDGYKLVDGKWKKTSLLTRWF